MNEEWSWDAPVYDSIREYVTDRLRYDESQSLYLLDNMLLTRLAKIFREDSDHVPRIVRYFEEKRAVFLIPDIIFEESARSKHTTSERYADWYARLFEALSDACPIVRVTFQDIYDIMTEGAINAEVGFFQFQEIAIETVRMNPDLRDGIAASKRVEDVQSCLYSVERDCGERILHLLACAVLVNGVSSLILLSDEEVGVFNTRYLCSRNERLLRLMYMQDTYVFLNSYRLQSFDCLLQDMLKAEEPHIVRDCVNELRKESKHQCRYVRVIFGGESDRRQLDNEQFVSTLLDEKASITF